MQAGTVQGRKITDPPARGEGRGGGGGICLKGPDLMRSSFSRVFDEENH